VPQARPSLWQMPSSSSLRRRSTALPWPFCRSASLGRSSHRKIWTAYASAWPSSKRAFVRWPASQRSGSCRRAWQRASHRPSCWRLQRLTPRSSRWLSRLQPTPLAPAPTSTPLALVRASFMQGRTLPVTPFLTPLSVLAAPSGGAAAEEGQGAVNALGMD
jgi:hypothetical protein